MLPSNQRKTILGELSNREAEALLWDWKFWARPKQIAPDWPFFCWVILTGRGWGKTRTGAEQVRLWVRTDPLVNIIGATADDARDIMIEGESGILNICPPTERPRYMKSDRRLDWPNGARSLIFTADEPDRLRGKQHQKIWADEVASWRYAESWDQAMMGLRLGTLPQAVVTTTPKPTTLIKNLIADKRNAVVTGTTYENRANLSPGFYNYVITKYEGTHLGRQELLAEILEDMPGALWTRKMIAETRVITHPDLTLIAVGVDPPGGATECGIVVAGSALVDGMLHGYVLEDRSLKASPDVWAEAVLTAYNHNKADRVVGEANYGGDMVKNTIMQAAKSRGQFVRYVSVQATRGKAVRAEPIVAMFEQGRIHMVGELRGLEDEMVSWVPGESRDSPNRVDALVWALTEVMQGRSRGIW